MPAKWFTCPDLERIEIKDCLKKKGCRLKRCATLPYLRMVGDEREYKGVSPSMAGSGARLIWLKATTDYAINPDTRAFAVHGVSVHGKLALHKYTDNIISEEKLSDSEMEGTPDCLEEDEYKEGEYILSDNKTWGSFKVAKALGIVVKKHNEQVINVDGEPVLLKSGKNKGKPKTVVVSERIIDKDTIDLRGEELQLNRYRIFFEPQFKISEMWIQAIVRDGNTYMAESRGINDWLYMIPINILPNDVVLDYYRKLQCEVDIAFKDNHAPMCGEWETWEGRRCNEKYCEVFDRCKEIGE